ncbi:MAG: PTS ascorbate transporter subunit IIC [Fimbriimonadaceae bacterium]|nr:PTS ascorbate transporter subunit IIC [Fimbriimonadaceae bacterium]
MAERKAFMLRISPELWDDLQRVAAEDFRSVNAQIEFLLREALAHKVRRKKSKSGESVEDS